MAGTAGIPAPVAGTFANAGVGGNVGGGAFNGGLSASELNSFRVSAVIDRLTLHVHGSRENDTVEFFNLCLSLARGIDFSIANHEVPSRSQELPSLIKQVCQNRNDASLLAAIMVLMISIKSTCQSGWFSDSDSEELRNLAKEIAIYFSSESNFDTEPNCSLSVISTIMSRFYPRMRMGHIFAFLEVKPGFDAYVTDFHISKDLKPSPGEKIRLFVVQADAIETSSCLITPSKVNFLLNGKGVERRTSLFMDPGPQIPSVVSHFLKYGSNLLQAIGEFNGNYIIAVAFMSEMPNTDSSGLQDYEQLATTPVDSDSEVIVGPSRISLNCPISFKRINTPVKGYSCNHIQCFDFNNYVDINARRPSWRCPHCNQYVCFIDIRIDRKMVKVLKEVGPKVSDIIMSSDGSWNPVVESDDTTDKPEDKTGQDEHPQPSDVMDLTEIDDDATDTTATGGAQDSKHFPDADRHQLMSQNASINNMAYRNDVNQGGVQIANGFCSGISMPIFGLVGSSNVQPSAQVAGVFGPTSVLTDSFTSPSTDVEAFHGNSLITNSVLHSGTSLPNTLQLQQHQFGSPSIANEYGRLPSVPRHVTRTPNAVQALPAQTPTPVLQQISRNSVNTYIPNGFSAASHVSPTAPNISTALHANQRPVSQVSSSPLLQQPRTQQNPFPLAWPHQQNAGFQNPNQAPNAYRVSNERHSSSQHMANLRTPPSMSQSPALTQSSMQSSRSFVPSQNHVGISLDRNVHRTSAANPQQAHLMAAANRTAQMAVEALRTPPSFLRNPDGSSMPSLGDQTGNSGVTSQPITRTDAYDPAEMNWRPAGRMRGALSGQAYADALNQFVIRPNQQAQAARPISNATSLSINVPAQRQAMMSGGAVQGTNPAPNYSSAGPSSRPMG